MKFIEEYIHDGIGYNAFLIREGWQVAKLNPLPGHGLEEIDKIEVHDVTDEVFVLIKGTAVLIGAKVDGDEMEFQTVLMKPGVVYNLPKGQWHNIAMGEGVEIIIVEKDNTHLNDCRYFTLNVQKQNELKQLIKQRLK